ncbi:MAG: aminopeptidase P family protein [Candidatus Heimdallarchaeota archaeon]|nr:aminopeptidase P family protein [Candidatus Heimdallarchaeota archaeon]
MIKERQKRLQELIVKSKTDCLLLFPGVDLFYATGLNIHQSERLAVSILPKEGEPIFICPSFEKSRMKKSLQTGSIETWEEDENPFELLGSIIKDQEIGKKVALDNKLWFEWFLNIKKQLPETNFCGSTEIVTAARIIKSAQEINIMRKATQIASEAIIRSFRQVKAGMSETEVSNIVKEELSKEGTPAFSLVQSGPNSALPHGNPSGRTIEKDDVLLIDAGPVYQGYYGDITITSVIGEPSTKFMKIYEIVYGANRAAFEVSKDGELAENVDKAARDYITKTGYGKYFTHRLGHGIGIEGHEPPYIVSGNKLVLKNGMCHTIEPGIYIEGEFGVRIEDDVVVRKDTCEFLFESPRKIWEMV